MRSPPAIVIALTLVAVATSAPTPAHADSIVALERQAARLDRSIARLQAVATRYATWRRCVYQVSVSEYGDPDASGSGYLYDERDGTGIGPRSALGLAPATKAGYAFLAFSRGVSCHTRPTRPGGTAEAARASPPGALKRSLVERVQALEAHVTALERRVMRVRRAAARFDSWESCLSQLPITAFGDPGGSFGFLVGPRRIGAVPRYRAAIAIDRTDWDDPDYRMLAFRRGDRPGRHCDNDPGEGSD